MKIKSFAALAALYVAGIATGAVAVLTLHDGGPNAASSGVTSAWMAASSALVDYKGELRNPEERSVILLSNLISLTSVIGPNFTYFDPEDQQLIHDKARALVRHWNTLSQEPTLVVTPEQAKPFLDCIAQGRLDDGGASIQQCSLDAHRRKGLEIGDLGFVKAGNGE